MTIRPRVYQSYLNTEAQELEMASRMAEIRLREAATELLKIEEIRQKAKINQDSGMNYLVTLKTISILLVGFSPLINLLGAKLIKASVLPKILSILSFGLIDIGNVALTVEAADQTVTRQMIVSFLSSLTHATNMNSLALRDWWGES